jgi:hypothetical protein
MNPVPANELVQGKRYYIQSDHPLIAESQPNVIFSGKKIGTFDRYQPGPHPGILGQVYFTNLTDIPGAQMPSGLGTIANNKYPDTFSFFEPQAEAIRNRFEQGVFETILGEDVDNEVTLNNPYGILPQPLGNLSNDSSVRENKIKTHKKATFRKTVGLPVSAVKSISRKFYKGNPPPGGGRRSRRRRKSRKSRRGRRSRKYKK